MAAEQESDQHEQPAAKRNRRAGSHYLSDHAVAARYEITRQTVWTWSKRGDLPTPIRLSPGCTRWRLADLEAFEASREAIQ